MTTGHINWCSCFSFFGGRRNRLRFCWFFWRENESAFFAIDEQTVVSFAQRKKRFGRIKTSARKHRHGTSHASTTTARYRDMVFSESRFVSNGFAPAAGAPRPRPRATGAATNKKLDKTYTYHASKHTCISGDRCRFCRCYFENTRVNTEKQAIHSYACLLLHCSTPTSVLR